MKPRQLGRVLMVAAFLLHVMVAMQQGQIFLSEEGVIRAVLDSDGFVTENGNLRVHQVRVFVERVAIAFSYVDT